MRLNSLYAGLNKGEGPVKVWVHNLKNGPSSGKHVSLGFRCYMIQNVFSNLNVSNSSVDQCVLLVQLRYRMYPCPAIFFSWVMGLDDVRTMVNNPYRRD